MNRTNDALTEKPDAETARAFYDLIRHAQAVAPDLKLDGEEVLAEGLANPLPPLEAEKLLTRLIDRLHAVVAARGDARERATLQGDVNELVRRAMGLRERFREATPARGPMKKAHTVHLLDEYNGIRKGPVAPSPVFHEKEVPVVGGFIKTTDINLWTRNERLDIHVGQFRAKHGRAPSPEELLSIMMGTAPLEGLGREDEFEILRLARSIAANGVRKPPIIDVDGTLLDGNRRVAACMLILNDTGEFSSEEKKRAEYVHVWQLTPHATEDDRSRVIVSLNFESDCKKEWPEYIKARKVAEEWESMLALEPEKPGPKKQAEMKKELSKRYALGPDTGVVNRYLKMVRWAEEFEDHHINERKRDRFAVQHAANRYFQYFDELAKGEKPGGVAWSLNQDDNFRRIVFDLLFEGKLESWKQVRDLKHAYKSDEARQLLAKAHEETDSETAQGQVENALAIAKAADAEARSLGANLRIESFTKWIEEVPPRTLRDDVKTENLTRLVSALRLVEPIMRQTLEARGAA